MKSRIFICLLLLILTIQCLRAQSFYDTTYHDNGKILTYGRFDKEKMCLQKYHYYYNGNNSFIEQYDFFADESPPA